jgi:ATP-dependent helicase/nuclease subunit B
MKDPKFQSWLKYHTFSPSELEKYKLCPFGFYASRYLKIEPPVDSEVELTPLEIGLVLHHTLERFLKKKGVSQKDLLGTATAEIEKIQKKRENLIPILVAEQKKRIERTLVSFFEKERGTQKMSPLKPTHFEWAFSSLEIPDASGKRIKLKGRIDRIDLDPINKTFLVIDYKTGSRKITGNQIRKGDALQLPLYVMAVKQLLLPDYEPIGGLYYHLSDLTLDSGFVHADLVPEHLEIKPRSSSIVPAAGWDELFELVQDKVSEIVASIKEENFRSEPEPCTPWCGYKDICRVRSASEGVLDQNIRLA